MKQGWKRKTIADVCTFIKNGANIKQERGAGGVPITRIETLSGGVFNRDRLGYANLATPDKYLSYVLEYGDLLFSHINSKTYIGRTVVYVPENDEQVIHGMNLLRLKLDFDLMSPFFFQYYTRTDIFKAQVANRRKDAVNQSSITTTDIKTISLPVPPIAEQGKIVAELDCLSGIIEKKKQQLKELDALAQSIFYEMFGENAEGRNKWKIAKLGNVCKTTSGGTPSKGHPEYYEGGDIPWLRSGEVNKMNIHETELFITEEGLNNSSAKWFPKGTVVIAMYGATVGQVGILCNPMTTNQAICGIFPNETFTPIYLYHFLLSKKPEYLEIATGGAQANISQNIVRDTVVSCPPLTLQQDFASKIEAIEKQKEQIAQSIKETETLFNSRMDYYFN